MTRLGFAFSGIIIIAGCASNAHAQWSGRGACGCSAGVFNFDSLLSFNIDWTLDPGDATVTGTAAGACVAVAFGQFDYDCDHIDVHQHTFGTVGDADAGAVDLTQFVLALSANANHPGIPAFANVDIGVALLSGSMVTHCSSGAAYTVFYSLSDPCHGDEFGTMFSEGLGAFAASLDLDLHFSSFTVAPTFSMDASAAGGWGRAIYDNSHPAPGHFIPVRGVNWIRLRPIYCPDSQEAATLQGPSPTGFKPVSAP